MRDFLSFFLSLSAGAVAYFGAAVFLAALSIVDLAGALPAVEAGRAVVE